MPLKANYVGDRAGVSGYSYTLSGIIEGLTPETRIYAPYEAIGPVFLALLYISGIISGYSLPACLPIAGLLIIAWMGSEKYSWWATCLIGICLSAAVIVLHLQPRGLPPGEGVQWCNQTLCLYLAYQAFYGRPGLFLPSLLCLIVTDYIAVTMTGNWDGVSKFIVLLFKFRYVRMLIIFVILCAEGSWLYQGDYISMLGYCHILLLLFSIHFRRGKDIVPFVLVLQVLFLFHSHQIQYDKHLPISKFLAW